MDGGDGRAAVAAREGSPQRRPNLTGQRARFMNVVRADTPVAARGDNIKDVAGESQIAAMERNPGWNPPLFAVYRHMLKASYRLKGTGMGIRQQHHQNGNIVR